MPVTKVTCSIAELSDVRVAVDKGTYKKRTCRGVVTGEISDKPSEDKSLRGPPVKPPSKNYFSKLCPPPPGGPPDNLAREPPSPIPPALGYGEPGLPPPDNLTLFPLAFALPAFGPSGDDDSPCHPNLPRRTERS
nr:hypothetical protein HmN_000989200 [Hymenolepis microstoma]